MFWLAVLVFAVATAWIVARIRRTIRERERAEEARAANMLAGLAIPAAAPANPASQPMRAAAVDELAQQKLLFESAHKAAEAGEPALAIQLYARLLARYPATAFAGPAREAVATQKGRLAKEG
jgi:hypothetical protein